MGLCQCRRRRKNTQSDIVFGPMKLKHTQMSILLVFPKDDNQGNTFWRAAERIGYTCHVTHNTDSALECYLHKQPDIVIIDTRSNKYFDAEALCRSMRATKSSEHTVLVAITKRIPTDKEEPSILPLLSAGFNKRLIENPSVSACMNELLCLEHGDYNTQNKLRATRALFTALDNVSDAVEIADDKRNIQYVNPAWERLTGYSCEEVTDTDCMTLQKNEKNKADLIDNINSQIRKGKYWEGTYYTRRKCGDIIPCHCHTSPVQCPWGNLSHIVSVKMGSPDSTSLERFRDNEYSLVNGAVHSNSRRKESLTKIHTMTIEAPITKVINIINAAQENSPLTVVQALDKVLEILRTSELYSPYFSQIKNEQDPMTSDLVGGLVSQTVKKQMTCSGSQDINSNSSSKTSNHPFVHIPSSPTTLDQIPDHIKSILAAEASWDFDIISLEKATKKRPLVYLGLKTLMRFGACEYLRISETCLTHWLQIIEASYHSKNTYHNSSHAADVLNASAYFLEKERNKNILDQVDVISSLIAAIIHDVDHPGRTNAFLVNESNELAILYNDQAVLENHHAALAFQLTWKNDQANIFKNLDNEEYKTMRQSIIDMVLATEMKHHFEHLNKFVNSINKAALKMDETSSMSGSGSPDSTLVLNQLCTTENKLLIKRMLIKCADVNNPCRPLHLCIEWGKRIAEEYFRQTDEEKSRGLPVVMPVFDRKNCSIPKSQTSFIDVFINDMFDAWDYYCDIPELLNHLQKNYQYWKQEEVSSHSGHKNSNSSDAN